MVNIKILQITGYVLKDGICVWKDISHRIFHRIKIKAKSRIKRRLFEDLFQFLKQGQIPLNRQQNKFIKGLEAVFVRLVASAVDIFVVNSVEGSRVHDFLEDLGFVVWVLDVHYEVDYVDKVLQLKQKVIKVQQVVETRRLVFNYKSKEVLEALSLLRRRIKLIESIKFFFASIPINLRHREALPKVVLVSILNHVLENISVVKDEGVGDRIPIKC